MADQNSNPNPQSSSMDPRSGFDSTTKIFHSIRPPVPLPPETLPLSTTAYVLSLLPNPLPSNPAFIDSTTSLSLSYPDLIHRVQTLSSNLQSLFPTLHSKPHHHPTAFILSPPSLHIPTLYLSLLSLGIVVSPSNPASTPSEISRQIQLSRPVIVFATSSTASKLPSSFPHPIIHLDSPPFHSLMTTTPVAPSAVRSVVNQSDPAAILYSSGTTGKFKGVVTTHRNFVAVITANARRDPGSEVGPTVMLFSLPLFHVYGFFMCLGMVATGETMVLMEKFEFGAMLRAIETHRVQSIPVAPPLVVAMAKSEEVARYDLSSLEMVACGGAPLGKEVVERFKARFPNVEILQGYGLTESSGGVTRTLGPEECQRYGSVGRLSENIEAKIVDRTTGEALSPGQQGELWLRGPTIMKGYVDDDEATASTLDSEGWLKTGDLCYIDNEGFLYIIDRLKELIKFKAYQVAPAELEQLLQSHPAIADAAVIPYPDEEAGQIPMAYVVRKPGSILTEKQVMDFIAKQMAKISAGVSVCLDMGNLGIMTHT
ncbi:4-coumarate--CoA ligase-like 9 isoform X2 [Magnolia sinica]|uniref:4-coumarate--CoA ligase-like 9 isoform X2 n=1 Tax=Magnolia sinica TaxID=86752 RepID=UPI0026583145|nr:4-coumarate--CoA ligase-like 9 isoform X2 [Magnolia sinica]